VVPTVHFNTNLLEIVNRRLGDGQAAKAGIVSSLRDGWRLLLRLGMSLAVGWMLGRLLLLPRVVVEQSPRRSRSVEVRNSCKYPVLLSRM